MNLRRLGREEREAWWWTHPDTQGGVDLRAIRPELAERRSLQRQVAHKIRERWRRMELRRWQGTQGRVPRECPEVLYEEKRMTKVRQLYADEDGVGRVILAGTFKSPAAVAVSSAGTFSAHALNSAREAS